MAWHSLLRKQIAIYTARKLRFWVLATSFSSQTRTRCFGFWYRPDADHAISSRNHHPRRCRWQNLLPLLQNEDRTGCDMVITQFFQSAAKRNYPMRAIQTKDYGYIWNPRSNGERQFRNESMSGRCFNAMKEAASDHPNIAARVDLFLTRCKEELYHFAMIHMHSITLLAKKNMRALRAHSNNAWQNGWIRTTIRPKCILNPANTEYANNISVNK